MLAGDPKSEISYVDPVCLYTCIHVAAKRMLQYECIGGAHQSQFHPRIN